MKNLIKIKGKISGELKQVLSDKDFVDTGRFILDLLDKALEEQKQEIIKDIKGQVDFGFTYNDPNYDNGCKQTLKDILKVLNGKK